jgi:hypothetical protein
MLLRRIEGLSRRRRWWAGALALTAIAWAAMYGKIWDFASRDAHRFTARAILTGTLRLRGALAHADGDEQIFHGGVYTNWGFGVPLLQVPFHALAAAVGYLHGFFPDRAIYFIYLCAAMPVIWAGFDRWLALRAPVLGPSAQSEVSRHVVAWCATWVLLTLTFVPLMSTRFLVFEETIAYMMICEYLALAGYFFASESWGRRPLVAMGAAAGAAVLVRPTGLLYLGVFGALVLLEAPQVGRRGVAPIGSLVVRARRASWFALGAAPFVATWLATNVVRTGSPFAIGFLNSNPAWEYETPVLRFGAVCTDTPWHFAQAAARLFDAFFFIVQRTASPWMRQCHFDFEERDYMRDPFLGPWVLVLLAGTLWGLVRRRERRVAMYLPIAAFATLFLAYVRRGDGFAWRYEGDFWPLVVLATVKYVDSLPQEGEQAAASTPRPTQARVAKVLFWFGFCAFARYWVPWEWDYRANVMGPKDVAAMWGDFQASRWDEDAPLPSKRLCTDHPKTPYHDGLGWRDGCTVATFTNFYLGVPLPRDGGQRYTLTLRTEGIEAPSVRVYFNGALYDAPRTADGYALPVEVDRAVMHSPAVMVTVRWVEGLVPPPGKFLWAELSSN